MAHPFYAIHTHGFVRVAAATPVATVGDTLANAAGTISIAEEADRQCVDLVVYPELNLTSYAIDDLHLQAAQQAATIEALNDVVRKTKSLRPLLLVGAALVRNNDLYNCAVAIHRGKILGVVPKTFLPNYREYYEKRWFASGAGTAGLAIRIGDEQVPFGTDLIFSATDLPLFSVHAEICEDYWAPVPPSTIGALAGALICCNLSASNIVVGKARERELLAAAQSTRALCAYVYSAAGPGESTTEVAWDGQGFVYELGELLAASKRFAGAPELVTTDVDLDRISRERTRNGTFRDAATLAGKPECRTRYITFTHDAPLSDSGLRRQIARFPFVPNQPLRLDEDCYEAFNIQVEALAKRMVAANAKRLIIGVSGGLDSTHALIIAAKTVDRVGLNRDAVSAFTLPGFATTQATKSNAWALMKALNVVAEEIDIRPTARQMLRDMDHPFAHDKPVYDIAFENVQAGLRTDYLFRLANQRNGIVVGTGDLSELALGWCTYGVGDQMSHYAVNAGVPKTMIQFLIRWCINTDQYDPETDRVLQAILDTEISPELVPPGENGEIQNTEERIGPYALNDLFVHYVVRYGFAPSKIAFLAWHAWHDSSKGEWPPGYPGNVRNEYDLSTIKFWLERFLQRFFGSSQFKRSALPNGPKVFAAGALSPRGDWRAPSDGSADSWLRELDASTPQ